ncbi:MAG: mechanosensitive ion channel, partial [Planctomycetes bacterium]|nr:mechanosensitive ion channel [Planctomycetota bacterium]
MIRVATCGFFLSLLAAAALAQAPTDDTAPEDEAPAPKQIAIAPTAEDAEIERRLLRILEATEWFTSPEVDVDEGVVFLTGRTETEEHKEWASRLARNTQDVVEVVNRIEVTGGPLWDLTPARNEVRELWRDALLAAPMMGVALLMLAVTIVATWGARTVWHTVFQRRMKNAILRQMAANAIAVVVLILGLYLILKISGLTRLAVTVLGGTGLFGLVVGIAFRDIAENFLASILLSVRRPFEIGDLIDIDGKLGFVQAVTTRGTLLITFEGNHIHVPNSAVYKSVINNYTANPNMRLDFTVGIGYDDAIATAQEVGVRVLRDHAAVLDDPEPMVLVDQLGSATGVLKFYFWVNIREHSEIKVRSAAMRLVKRAFQEAGVSMPDEAREVLFPQGVPVRMLAAEEEEPEEAAPAGPRPSREERLTTEDRISSD